MNRTLYISIFTCLEFLHCLGITFLGQGSDVLQRENSSEPVELLKHNKSANKSGDLVLLDAGVELLKYNKTTNRSHNIFLLDGERARKESRFNAMRPKYALTLYNHNDINYMGKVTVAGHTVVGFMDTGSSELLTFAKPECRGCSEAAAVACEDEECTVEDTPERCLQYSSGQVCANRVIADVAVGPLTRTGHSFMLAYSAEAPLEYINFRTIFGLGPPKQASDFLSGLGVQNFSACFPAGANGKLTWNDDAHFPDHPHGNSFVSMPAGLAAGMGGVWGVVMTHAQLDGPSGQHSLGCSPSCGAVMDTGSSLIGVPTEIYNEAMKGMKSLGGNCKHPETLPSIKFKLNGHEFALPPEVFVGSYASEGKESVLRPRCELLMLDLGKATTTQGPMWVLGMPFFRYYYTTFDLGSPGWPSPDHMKVHIAPMGRSCQPGSRMSLLQYQYRRKLKKINLRKIQTPKWLHSMQAATRAGAGNTTLPS